MAKVSNVQAAHQPQAAPAEMSLAERIKADATRIEKVKDAAGRIIGVKKLNFLDTHHVTCMLGDDAQNAVALRQALMSSSVVEIDGQPISRPRTRSQLEALMAQLDFHGVTAATEGMNRFTSYEVDAGPATDEIKN